MNFDDTKNGYRAERGREVLVRPGPGYGEDIEWIFSVEAEGATILQGALTEESVKSLWGEGDIKTCASIFEMLQDAAQDWPDCDVFDVIDS